MSDLSQNSTIFRSGDISLQRPSAEASMQILANENATKTREDKWLLRALAGESDVDYFFVYEQGQLIGQICLHDIDTKQRSSLISYVLFRAVNRNRGVGTTALQLLLKHTAQSTNLEQLVIITSVDNYASRRVAEKCGFGYIDPAQEGLPQICYSYFTRR